MENITVILEGFLYFILLRFILVAGLSQINKLNIIPNLITAIAYYIFIILIAIHVGRRIARKATVRKIFSALIAVILYTLVSLTAFVFNIYLVEFVLLSILNIVTCIIAAYFETKKRRI